MSGNVGWFSCSTGWNSGHSWPDDVNTEIGPPQAVVDAAMFGAIKLFFAMAWVDGRLKGRGCYPDVAQGQPQGTVTLTAVCATYQDNELDLGDIAAFPGRSMRDRATTHSPWSSLP